jgi:hypothetical protein
MELLFSLVAVMEGNHPVDGVQIFNRVLNVILRALHRICTAIDPSFSWELLIYERIDLIHLNISRAQNRPLQKIFLWKSLTSGNVRIDGLNQVRDIRAT